MNFKKWLLKRFKVKLGFPIEHANIKLQLKLRLLIKGDGEPIYLKKGEGGIWDRGYSIKYGDNGPETTKYMITLDGKRVVIKNFTFIGTYNDPAESFQVD